MKKAARWIDYMPLVDVEGATRNPKKHAAGIADAIGRFGYADGVILDERTGRLVAGHGRVETLRAMEAAGETPPDGVEVSKAGWLLPVQRGWSSRSDKEAEAFLVAHNRLTEEGGWDDVELLDLLDQFGDEELAGMGVDETYLDELAERVDELQEEAPPEGEDAGAGEPPEDPVSERGEIYALGPHRLMCGDSTSAEDVAALLGGEKAVLLHADPPYGMGKEKDGVENDNLYRDKLDQFQIDWWKAWRPALEDNASVYIWGNPADLWRLWYSAGLGTIERLTFRNEIVWDKGSGMGMSSDSMRQYATSTERCLFFMIGAQSLANLNKEDFYEGFAPILDFLLAEAEKVGWGAKDIKRICGVGMWGHWFSRSQWVMIPERHYASLKEAAGGKAFSLEYSEIGADHEEARSGGGHREKHNAFNESRSYFDNRHDNMNDVWSFPRVVGEERQGHATPKPVDMIARAILSSCPDGGIALEPFLGSGTTLIAAAKTGRKCYGMEISSAYCDVIRKRWGDWARSAEVDPGPDAL
jgi:DNA modification methylase